MKVFLITSRLDGYDDSYTVKDVVATPELAEEWAGHYRRQDRGYTVAVEAWDVEELPPGGGGRPFVGDTDASPRVAQ